ncbi:MAG: MFS transporter, partial [Pseudolabrys sp.]|nr:MFS transporter [Pseudolabrys sp.]
AALMIGGAGFLVAYWVHAKRTPVPALDLTLFRLTTFRVSVIGGFIFRLGIGALPFLLPLMLQLGFGLSPFHSGMITFASAAGAMGMKAAASTLLRRFGFRTILLANALISAVLLAACGLFTAATPAYIMLGVLLIGGFFRSLQFTSINTLAYAEVEHERVSRATSLVAVGQQLALSSGVAVGALAVDLAAAWHGHATLVAEDFPPAFFAVAAISATSVVFFLQLPHDAGAEISGRGLLAPKAKGASEPSPSDAKN